MKYKNQEAMLQMLLDKLSRSKNKVSQIKLEKRIIRLFHQIYQQKVSIYKWLDDISTKMIEVVNDNTELRKENNQLRNFLGVATIEKMKKENNNGN